MTRLSLKGVQEASYANSDKEWFSQTMAATGRDEDDFGLSLVKQLGCILDSDPFIDELGFVHPSQLASLYEMNLESLHIYENVEGNTISASKNALIGDQAMCFDRSAFWCANHKLAISVSVLPSLYGAAKSSLLVTRHEYDCYTKSGKVLCHTSLSRPLDDCDCLHDYHLVLLKDRLMAYSRVLVIISSDCKSAWNARKKVIASTTTEEILAVELRLSSLALSYDPKSEESWAHRRWVIVHMINSVWRGKIAEHILQGELKLVGRIAERSKMNYRAWRHCCWLVHYMSPSQVTKELEKWKEWAQLHVADNCCWHFRRCLFQRIMNCCNYKIFDAGGSGKYAETENQGEHSYHILQPMVLWKDELRWNEDLINSYPGREALWMHRRFLFYLWFLQVKPNIPVPMCLSSCSGDHSRDFKQVMDTIDYCDGHCCIIPKEMELVNTYLMMFVNDNEDAHRQQLLAATYKLWVLLKLRESQHCSSMGPEVCRRELFQLEDLLKRASPHWRNLWEGLFQKINADACGNFSQ